MPDPLPKPLRSTAPRIRKRPQPRRQAPRSHRWHAPRSHRQQTRHPSCRLRTATQSPTHHRLDSGDTLREGPALQLQHSPRLRQRLFDSPRPSLSLANPIAPFRQSAKGWKARSRKRRADNESMRTRSEASKSCETRSPPRPAPSQTVPRPHFPASFPPRPTRRGAPPPRARRARAPHAKPTPIRARPGFAPGVQRPSARSPNPHVAPARQTNSPAAARLLRPRRARRSAIGNPHRSLRLRRRRTSAGSEASPRRSRARGSFSPPRRARRPRTGRDRAP